MIKKGYMFLCAKCARDNFYTGNKRKAMKKAHADDWATNNAENQSLCRDCKYKWEVENIDPDVL